jgi:membrane associated rhomboid family serine protease
VNFAASFRRRLASSSGTDLLLGTLVALVAVQYVLIAADRISGSNLSLGWQNLWALGAEDVWKPWKWLSYAFLHADLYHALWNLLILHFVGHAWEDRRGHRSPWFLFLAGAAAGAFSFLALSTPDGAHHALVGASAGTTAVLGALTVRQPRFQTKLAFWWVPLYAFAALLLAVDLAFAVGYDLSAWAHLSGFALGAGGQALGLWSVSFNAFKRPRTSPHLRLVPGGQKNTDNVLEGLRDPEARLNAVLDKISRDGVESLSSEERAYLEKIQK